MNNLMGYGSLGGETACTVTDIYAAGPNAVQFTTSYELLVEGAHSQVRCVPETSALFATHCQGELTHPEWQIDLQTPFSTLFRPARGSAGRYSRIGMGGCISPWGWRAQGAH